MNKYNKVQLDSEGKPIELIDEKPIVNEDSSIIFINNLPSKGLSYPKDFKVGYIPYTFGELRHISSSNYMNSSGEFDSNKLSEITRLSLSKLKVRNFDIKNLTYMDFEFINLHKKLSSIGGIDSSFKLGWKCSNSECKHENKTEVMLSDIQFPDIKVNKLPIKVNLLDGTELIFSFSTIGRELELLDNLEYFKDKDSYIIELAKLLINSNTLIENYDIISNIDNPEDIELLNYIYELLDYSYKDLNLTCKYCNKDSVIPFRNVDEFIVSKDGFRESIKSRIKFG